MRKTQKTDEISGLDNWSPAPVLIGDVVAVAGGDYHTLALRPDGTVWAWGANWQGRLGDGTTTDRHAPVQTVGLTGVAEIAGGTSLSRSHSLFIGLAESLLPIVVGTWPVDDACDVGVPYAVVTFDRPVVNISADDLVLSAGTVTAVTGDQNGPYFFEITGAPRGTIVATLDGDIEDLDGNDLAAYQWTFLNQSFSGFDGDCDVDLVDIEVFAACVSGPVVEHNGAPACLMADFDDDDDVDQSDFGIFQRCISGDGNPADPDCAD